MLQNTIFKYLITALIGMTPIIELRGAIPIAYGYFKLSYFEAFLCSFVGNIIPIYFIVKYIGPVFKFLRKFKPFRIIIDWVTTRASNKIAKDERLQNFTALGLFLFVAIPLPGTGAWVGSLIANMLEVPVKKALPPLIIGVFTAGIIMLTITAVAAGGISILFQ